MQVTPPHDLDAEESLLGAMLLSNEAIAVTEESGIGYEDFYKPSYAFIFSAIIDLFSEGRPVDAVTVADRLRKNGTLELIGDPTQLVALQANTPSFANAGHYAQIVQEHAVLRRLLDVGTQISELVYALPEDVSEVVAQAERLLLGVNLPRCNTEPEALTFEEWQGKRDEEAGEWLCENMITRDSFFMVIAPEGLGKATMMRWLGMQLGQGIDPFTRWETKPLKVLYADFENPLRNILHPSTNLQQTLMNLRKADYDPTNFKIWRKPAGVNILKPADRANLEREVADFRPDLVLYGPLVRSFQRGRQGNYEDLAADVIDTLRKLRDKYQFGLIVEHHMPKNRQEGTPMGSQLWMGSPDVGIKLLANHDTPLTLDIGRFRGDRFEVKWPDQLRRTEHWVFEPVFNR